MGREWGKRRREFSCLLFCCSMLAGDSSRHGRLVYTYKRVVCVYLLVCLSVCFLSATRHLSTLRRCLRVLRESSQAVAGGPARGGQAHAQRERTRAHAVQLLNEKIAALMPFKNKTVHARACCRIRNCRDFQKKGKKTNMPLPKFSLQFDFSWSVYFSNRTESYSSQIEFAGPHGIICNFTFSYLILSKTIGRKRLRT